MTRQSRTLLLVAVMAVAAVVALALMANRYRKVLKARGSRTAHATARNPAAEAFRQVDAFIAVRQAVGEAEPGEEVLRRAGLDRDRYQELSKAFRRWKVGDPTLDPYLRAAFDDRSRRSGGPALPAPGR